MERVIMEEPNRCIGPAYTTSSEGPKPSIQNHPAARIIINQYARELHSFLLPKLTYIC